VLASGEKRISIRKNITSRNMEFTGSACSKEMMRSEQTREILQKPAEKCGKNHAAHISAQLACSYHEHHIYKEYEMTQYHCELKFGFIFALPGLPFQNKDVIIIAKVTLII
jgi:hypothetical protein